MGKKLLIMDTILRDAHQSQAATRMTIEDMLPALETLDSIGYYSLECWGGATFDACMRFLGEDPWERLRTIRKHVKNTKLQMLFRGQNILGYKHYADDVVDELFSRAKKELIQVIRSTQDSGEQAIDYLMIAKYFERIGDHATNIAEWVIFSVTGEHKEG